MRVYLRRFTSRLAQMELIVLLAMLLLVAAVWGFVALADEVMEKDTQHFDEWVLRKLRKPHDPSQPIGPKWLHELGRDITALGGVAVLTAMTAAIAGFLAMRRQYHAMWLVISATAGGLIISTILKRSFDRPRPSVVPHLSHVYTSSFPSGHSMLSAVVYLTLGALLARFVAERRLKIYIISVAALLTAAVGVSRVFMGVHYPTDVLAGWTAGLTWAILCWLIARQLQKRGTVEQEGETTN